MRFRDADRTSAMVCHGPLSGGSALFRILGLIRSPWYGRGAQTCGWQGGQWWFHSSHASSASARTAVSARCAPSLWKSGALCSSNGISARLISCGYI